MSLANPTRLEHIYARYTPVRVDDLNPKALAQIGSAIEWYAAWEITLEDDEYRENKFAGQWAWMPVPDVTYGGWVPSMDLTELASASCRLYDCQDCDLPGCICACHHYEERI